MSISTVVEVDLVGYSDVARVLEEILDAQAVARLNEQIQHFVDAGLKSAGAERDQAVLKTTGDGAILAFDRAEDAHRFSVELHIAAGKYNVERGRSASQRWFRIGVATGELYRDPDCNGQDFAGTVVADAVRLEGAARPGQIVADGATVARLPAELQIAYGPEEVVAGKRTERFIARRYTVVPYTPTTRETTNVPAKPKSSATADQRQRQRMIKRVRLDWIEGVLKQSLHQVARIELSVETAEEEVERPRNALLQIPDRSPVPVDAGKTAGRIFDDLGQALLILGAPGAGKTTFLLELAEELLDNAEQDDNEPIPVVFNLSSWALRRMPLDRWLIAELNERSDVPRNRAKQWIESDQIAPLLDGLDEVAQEHRRACVEAINAFRNEHGLLPIAICSRIADYKDLSVKLRLQNAILIQSLTREQVERYVQGAGEPLHGLRAALQDDPSLWELLETPLMLWVAILTYRHSPIVFSPEEGLEHRRTRLLANFVDAMFKRRPGEGHYSRAETVHWLSALARAQVRLKQSVVYLESLNGDWLPDSRGRLLQWSIPIVTAFTAPLLPFLVYCSLVGIVYAVGSVLNPGPHPPMRVPISMGAILAGILALALAFYLAIGSRGLVPAERVRWRPVKLRSVLTSWRVAWYALLFFLVEEAAVACLYVTPGNFLPADPSPFGFTSLLADVPVCVFAAVALTYLSRSLQLEQPVRVRPNEGTRNSARNAVRFGVIAAIAAGTPIGILWAVYGAFDPQLFAQVPGSSPLSDRLDAALSGAIAAALSGTSVGAFVGLFKGGLFSLQNLFARLALWLSGAAPLRYVDFLQSAVDRLFLRRVGGGYAFVHRMVMEYFASMPAADSR